MKEEIEKIPENYQENTPKMRFRIFLVFRGVFEGVFRGVSFFCMLGGIFEFLDFLSL